MEKMYCCISYNSICGQIPKVCSEIRDNIVGLFCCCKSQGPQSEHIAEQLISSRKKDQLPLE